MRTRIGRSWIVVSAASFGALLAACAGRGTAPATYTERAQTHYARVDLELRATDVAVLTPEQREARNQALDALRDYSERGEFTRNTEFPGARVPYFVDDEGRRCAVAELLHVAGEDEMVARVARTANHAWVADLAGDPAFRGWLDRSGLTIEEAARIQVPGSDEMYRAEMAEAARQRELAGAPNVNGSSPSSGSSGGSASGSSGSSTAPAKPGSSGSTGAAGSPPTEPRTPTDAKSGSGGSSSGGSAGGRTAGGAPGGGDPGTGADGARGGAGKEAPAGVDAGSWWRWWEFSKLDFVTAHPLRLAGGVDALGGKRTTAATIFAASLADESPTVRGAAAVALGRVAGEAAVPGLVRLLDDPDRTVRERALLALGATGSEAGAKVLAEIAKGGGVGKDGQDSPETRALAILALAVARRYGLDPASDADVASLLEDAKKRDLADVGVAAFVHAVLTTQHDLEAAAVREAGSRNDPDPVRSRAIESLGARTDDRALAALRGVVGDRRPDIRRAAAVALGDAQDPLFAAQAATAYELETEPLTRGFLLLSIGRLGGPRARGFLEAELAQGPETLRPWAALGLGLYARASKDPAARTALRAAELPAASRGAQWIALGLAGDATSLPTIATVLLESTAPIDRSIAGASLALIGGDDAHAALATALAKDKSEFVRVVCGWGIGSLGLDEDAPALLSMVESVQDPGMNGVAAVALGLNGSEACLDGALRRAGAAATPAARAAAIEAAGLLLSRAPGLVLHEASNRTNFAVMPRWLRSALAVTL